MSKKKNKEMNNIVRIGNDSKYIESYEHAILLRMHPKVYNKYNCIKLQVTRARLMRAEYLINIFKFAGLKEKSRQNVELVSDKGYTLKDSYEIILEKIPVLRLQLGEENDE